MSVYYSKTTKGFHHSSDGMHNVPNDAVEISEQKYKELLDGQSKLGKLIVSDNSGNPILVDYPEPETPSYDVLRASEYPSIGDQLDALFHAGVFPSDMADKIQAVKDKYPKV